MFLSTTHKRRLLVLFLLLGVLLAGVYYDRITLFLQHVVSENTPPFLFVFFFIILPVAGFPVSLFLILLGAKFGYYKGTLLMFGCMSLHLLATYLIANSYIRPFLDDITSYRYRIPKIPDEHAVQFSIVFMAVPGLSYAMKNYLLSLSGVPFRHYFLIGLFINGILGVPVIIAGDFLKSRPVLLISIFAVVLAVGYASRFALKRRRRSRTAI
jgi:uncharacterized membrane protein YdjX (TVP38/TMEM64 family)